VWGREIIEVRASHTQNPKHYKGIQGKKGASNTYRCSHQASIVLGLSRVLVVPEVTLSMNCHLSSVVGFAKATRRNNEFVRQNIHGQSAVFSHT
jgi:hypothetical protein